MVDTWGHVEAEQPTDRQLINKHFRPASEGIIHMLDLQRAICKLRLLAGFGREEPEFGWERTDKAEALRADAGL